MLSRREFLGVASATAALGGLSGLTSSALTAGKLSQNDLLRFDARGQLTILHITDIHAQLLPLWYREPAINLGVGEAKGLLPHVTGDDLLKALEIEAGSPLAYALSSSGFEALARQYGRVGGMDRVATLVGAIRAERGANRVLLLDGGDGLQGSFTAMATQGGDMVSVLEALGVEATTGHWEFTLGEQRMLELFGNNIRAGSSTLNFLASNVVDRDFEERIFHSTKFIEKGGVMVAVIGQAFPYTPIANPHWQIPSWSMGIREAFLRKAVVDARAAGAEVIVVLSHNGFDVDRKLARRIPDIDVILTAHSHDALSRPVRVGGTLLIASGSHGKFLSRLDLEIRHGRVVDHAYALIPVLADAITPDAEMARRIATIRRPHQAMLTTELARTETTLYRRGNFAGTFDDLICNAMLEERDAEIAFSPGFRWGSALLPGEPITHEDIFNATAISYPACYRLSLAGATIKSVLEDVADNLFNPDPYYQQGGDMVRAGGLAYTINIDERMGHRISELRLAKSGQPIEPARIYTVAGWASVNPVIDGPPIWDVIERYLGRHKTVRVEANTTVRVVRGGS